VKEFTVEELVEQFVAIALAQDTALDMNEIGKFNRLFRKMDAVKLELKSRPGDQRRALIPLYNHPNAQVRLKAAKSTLALAPEAARQTMQKIIAGREFPQALDAGMLIRSLDRGEYKPT
jgi:hypothetical protein